MTMSVTHGEAVQGAGSVEIGTELKRKREIVDAPEIEIDVSLPEPLSKKALRKSKRAKVDSEPRDADQTADKDVLSEDSESDETAAEDASKKKSTANGAKVDADSKQRSDYGIWIGNLPWTANKQALRTFFTSNSNIQDNEIVRIHMPPPPKATGSKTQLKPTNKGFAYVDFSTEEALKAVIGLSEKSLGGRNVLIKNAKSFEGRPVKRDGDSNRKWPAHSQKPPSRRVFVGNLGFDVTKEDLRKHYETCGEVEDLHMATFEDTGKCKGFAWVTFAEIAAAEAAVKGFVLLEPRDKQQEDLTESSDHEDQDKRTTQKKPKMRKWYVNRLEGRELRCEFAEDSATRYKKRFGKEASSIQVGDTKDGGLPDAATFDSHVEAEQGIESNQQRRDRRGKGRSGDDNDDIVPGAPTDRTKRRGKIGATVINAQAQYRTGAISESRGVKVSFA